MRHTGVPIEDSWNVAGANFKRAIGVANGETALAEVQAALRKLDLPEEENLKQSAVLLDGLCAAQLQIKS